MGGISRLAESLIADHEVLLKDLVDLRKQQGLSQDEVARRMGVSQSTVAGFEQYDADPTLSTLRRYALAVGARVKTQVVGTHRKRKEARVCSVCGTSVRPYKSRKTDYPGTIAQGCSNPLRCITCHSYFYHTGLERRRSHTGSVPSIGSILTKYDAWDVAWMLGVQC